MKHGLSDTVVQKIHAVLSRHPEVEEALLYGSRAKGNFKPSSDIDLTLRGDAGLTLAVLCRIADELDDLLLPYTIDLSIYSDIRDAGVLEHIRRVGVSFYKKAVVEETL